MQRKSSSSSIATVRARTGSRAQWATSLSCLGGGARAISLASLTRRDSRPPGSGAIDQDELAFMLRSLGQNPTEDELQKLIHDFDDGEPQRMAPLLAPRASRPSPTIWASLCAAARHCLPLQLAFPPRPCSLRFPLATRSLARRDDR